MHAVPPWLKIPATLLCPSINVYVLYTNTVAFCTVLVVCILQEFA